MWTSEPGIFIGHGQGTFYGGRWHSPGAIRKKADSFRDTSVNERVSQMQENDVTDLDP